MKEVKIKLDDKVVEILSKIEPFQRETFINYCVRLGVKSHLYKILVGEEEGDELILDEEIDESPFNDSKKVNKKVEEEINNSKSEPEPDLSVNW